MLKVRWWLVWGAISVLVFSGFLLSWNVPRGNKPEYETSNDVSLKVWIYSPPLAGELETFRQEHPDVTVDVRIFRSAVQLYTELAAAITANTAPSLAEIDSASGIAGLADTGALLPLPTELAADINERFLSSYRYAGKLWGLPYGGEVPVVYYNAELVRSAGFTFRSGSSFTWSEMVTWAAGSEMDLNNDGIIDIWGLVADRDTPWYLSNLVLLEDGAAINPELSAYRLWHNLIYKFNVMPPLNNHEATSTFINGRAALLMSSSEKRATLEKYIGGKFEFGILPFPEIAGKSTLVPRSSGFVIPDSPPAVEDAALEVLRFLNGIAVQSRLLTHAALLPVSQQASSGIWEQPNLTDNEKATLSMLSRLNASGDTQMGSSAAWQKLLAVQEELESTPGFNISN